MNRHVLAVASGIVGGSIPNTKSNINPILMGALIAGLVVKVLVGDYDKGFQWSLSDIVFWTVTMLEGALGAYFVRIV